MKLDELGTERQATREIAATKLQREQLAAPKLGLRLARFSVLVAKIVALASLLFGLFSAFGLLIALALGVSDSGSLSGSLIYLVGNLLLAWVICRAKPVSTELAGKDAAATIMFIVLMVVISFVNLIAVAAVVSAAFDSGYLIYGIVTLLLAGGISRAKSVASFSVMLLLEALAFITLTFGVFSSGYEGAPRSDGPAGTSLADLVTDLRQGAQPVARYTASGQSAFWSRGRCG